MKRKSRKTLSLLLSLLMLCSVAIMPAYAVSDPLLALMDEVEHAHEHDQDYNELELSDISESPTEEESEQPTDEETVETQGSTEPTSQDSSTPAGDPSGPPQMEQSVPGPTITFTPNENDHNYSEKYLRFFCYAPSVTVTDESQEIQSVEISVEIMVPIFKDGKTTFKNVKTNIDDITINAENNHNFTYDLKDNLGTITVTATNKAGGTSTATASADHMPSTINGRSYEANCAEPARSIKTYVCKFCSARYFRSYTYNGDSGTGHTFDEEAVTTIDSDSCCEEIEGQITIKTCTQCGFKEVTKDGQPYEFKSEEHTWETKTRPAECETPGTTWEECSECGAVKNVSTIPAIGHAFDKTKWDEEIPADCRTQTNGKLVKYCLEDGCDKTSEQVIPWSHTWSSRTKIKEPTCTEYGKSGFKCTVCDAIREEYQQDDIPPTGHEYSDNHDCTTQSTCSKCQQQVEAQSQHNWSSYWRSDSRGHWHECLNEGCTQISDIVQHTPIPNANCLLPTKCSVCDYEISPNSSGSHNLVYEHNASYHWQKCITPGCNFTTAKVSHTLNTDYDCTTEDKCTVCNYVAYQAQSDHNLGYYQSSHDGHFKSCRNPQCNYKTPVQAHSALNDYNCTTSDNCSYCGYTVRVRETRHNYTDSPYYSNGTSGHYMKCQNGDCNITSVVVPHHGGTATCTAAAICVDCNSSYGDVNLNNHQGGTEVKDHRDPTLEAEGYTGNTYCLGCGQKIADGTSIPKLEPEHTHSFTKTYDDTGSWEQCECGVTQNRKNHTFDNDGAMHSDAQGHWKVCDTCEYATTKVAHTPDEEDYNCTTAEYCTECNYEIVAPLTHTYGDNYAFNEGGHWHVCTNPNCAVTTETAEHRAVDDGNCETPLVCEDCGHTLEAAKEHAFSSVWNQGGADGHYQLCENQGCTVRHTSAHIPALEDGNCETPIICTICEYIITPEQHHSFANSPYYGNETGHWFVCQNPDCTARSEVQEHSGGTATCKTKAVCETCGTYYGALDPDNHEGGTEVRNHYNPTTENDGYSGDIYCLGCEQIITRGHLLDKIPEDHVHVYDTFGNDEHYHWDECECGAWDEESREEHIYNSYISGSDGHWKVCEVCGRQSAVEVHTPAENDYDCTTSLNCTVCGYEIEAASEGHSFGEKFAYDANGHWHVCTNPNCNQTADAEEHSAADDGDCTTQLVCEDCGYIIKEAQQHEFTGDWQSDGNKHWHICANDGCEQKDAESEHSGGIANCRRAAVCEVCGVAYGEIDPNNHVGGTEIRDHKNPTEAEAGYTGDTYCLGCNQKIADGEEIPVLDPDHEHDYGDKWVTDDLNHWHECSCGSQTDKAAHEYIDGICSVCGAKDPNYQQPIYEIGDGNNDGEINATDATLILQYFAKIITDETTNVTFNKASFDVNGDNEVDATDATLVLQYFAKIITSFPEAEDAQIYSKSE